MKLFIHREQEQVNDDIMFTSICRLELTEEEQVLAKRYGVPLSDLHIPKIEYLTAYSGLHIVRRHVQELREIEQSIIAVCRKIPEYWQAAQDHQGEEEIQI